MMKVNDFCDTLERAACETKTLYILGCFGAPMNEENKSRYTKNYPFNAREDRAELIKNATSDTFGFDCVCLIKGILWGWCGDVNSEYGGAVYNSNGVPDVDESDLLNLCNDVTTDFSTIQKGEMVWIYGHCGVYIGDGKVVECTYNWDDGVQITKLGNISSKYESDKVRVWSKHGKLPYVDYRQSVDVLAEQALKIAHENYIVVQDLVNAIKSGDDKTIEELAYEVIEGKWGNGEARKIALTSNGYNYTEVQQLVNKILTSK